MKKTKSWFENFIEEFGISISRTNIKTLDRIADTIYKLRQKKGRLFIIGLGGSAGNASHAVNDFKKLCQVVALSPLDNISEFSANLNDFGLENSIVQFLKVSKLNKKDVVLVFSVGGGDIHRKSSIPIIESIKYAKKNNTKVISITGLKNGFAGKNSNINLSLNVKTSRFVTPFAETYQALIWHALVSHPKLQKEKTFW